MPSTSLGFPYPTLTDAPSGPTQMQALAASVDAWLSANVVPLTYITLGRSATYTVLADGNQHAVQGWDQGILFQAGNIGYNGGGSVVINVAGRYRFTYQLQWPSTTVSNTHHKRVGTLWVNGSEPGRFTGKTTTFVPDGAADPQDMAINGTVFCNAGDLVQPAMFQNSNGAEVISPSVFTVWRVA